MKRKVLILYATYGTGHKTIANYIKNYFETNGNYECLTIDLINYSVPIFGNISKKTSEFIMTKVPTLWTLLYFSFDNKILSYISGNLTPKIFNNKKLKNEIKNFNPDITIGTHFFGTDLICYYNKHKITNSKVINVITDYRSHNLWNYSKEYIDKVIASSTEEKIHLLKTGYKISQIETIGIPIKPDMFETDESIEQLKIKYKINNDKKTILFFAGGGIGSSYNLVYLKELLKNKYKVNIIFISGRGKEIYKKAKYYKKKYNASNLKIFGFITKVNELYKISDIVITKPGGAQVTECLLFNKPMILIKGNGGQELANKLFLIRKGYAKNTLTTISFNKNIKDLIYNDKELNNMKKKIKKLEQNKSMEKLFKIVEKL